MKLNRKNLEKIWVIEEITDEMDIMDFWHSVKFFIYKWTQRIQNYSCWISYDELKDQFEEYQNKNKEYSLNWDDYKTIKTWKYEYRKLLTKWTNSLYYRNFVYMYNPEKKEIIKHIVRMIDDTPKVKIKYKWYAIRDKKPQSKEEPKKEIPIEDLPF